LSSSAIIPNTETPRENDTLISDFGARERIVAELRDVPKDVMCRLA